MTAVDEDEVQAAYRVAQEVICRSEELRLFPIRFIIEENDYEEGHVHLSVNVRGDSHQDARKRLIDALERLVNDGG